MSGKVLFKSNSGFFLMENLIVLSILAVTLLISVLTMRVFIGNFLFYQSVTQVVSDIEEVQHQAEINSKWCRIVFLTTVPNYYIYYGTTLVAVRKLPTSIHYPNGWISLPSSTLSFDGTGGPSTAGTLQLVDDVGHSARIIVYVGSGIVSASFGQ